MQIAFPKSSEDHRLQLVDVNGSIFAILHSPLESLGPIRLQCESWSLVLLAEIKSKSNILISATHVICLNEIASEEGNVNIHASHRLVKFTNLIKAHGHICEMGEEGTWQFDDDPGAFLYYYRLFGSMVSNIRRGTSDSLVEAQQQMIMSLCTLADKLKGKPGNLDLSQVLKAWDISNF